MKKLLVMKKIVALAGLMILFLIHPRLLFAQATLDPSFSQDGWTATKIDNSRDDIGQSVAIQPDKKIVVAGNSFDWLGYSNIGVVRYKPNGKPDPTFNQAGIKIINDGFCNVVAIQNDGKIVVGGSVAQGSSTLFGVWRLNADGSTDNTFGTNGFKSIAFSGYVICFTMLIQPDGKILIAGNDGNFYAGHASMAIARLTTDGSLDNTFSGDGKFTLNLTNKSLQCQKLLLQPDGKIIAAGTLDTIILTAFFQNEFFCTRLNSDGTMDNTFGVNGIQRQRNSNSDNCYAAGLMPDGKIILGGFSEFTGYNSSSVLCLNQNGTVNASYGTNGWTYIDMYGGSQFITGLAIQKNGKAIFAGYVYLPDQKNAVVVGRLKKNGTLDNAFTSGGMDTFFLSSSSKPVACNDVVLQKDNNIVITGYITLSNDAFLTARILNANPFSKESDSEPIITSSFVDLSCYPNPVSGNTMILSFNLQYASTASISICDINGRQIIEPVIKEFPKGPNTIELRLPDQLASGIYFCRFNVSEKFSTLKFEVKQEYR